MNDNIKINKLYILVPHQREATCTVIEDLEDLKDRVPDSTIITWESKEEIVKSYGDEIQDDLAKLMEAGIYPIYEMMGKSDLSFTNVEPDELEFYNEEISYDLSAMHTLSLDSVEEYDKDAEPFYKLNYHQGLRIRVLIEKNRELFFGEDE